MQQITPMHDVRPLAALVKGLSSNTILVGYRIICDGDERNLLPEEAPFFSNSAVKVQRQSGAARLAARTLLTRLNLYNVPIPRTSSRAPVWPRGIVGSLAHDSEVAVAAVGRATDVLSLGIDIEPAEPLPFYAVDRVPTPSERQRYGEFMLNSRYLFVAKEAVYKAAHPIDNIFLDFQDIEIDFEKGVAHVSYGRTVIVEIVSGNHIIALARIDA